MPCKEVYYIPDIFLFGWPQPSSPVMYQSLFMIFFKIHPYLLSAPLHILWVIDAFQWLSVFLHQLRPGEQPGVLPLFLFVKMKSISFFVCPTGFFHVYFLDVLFLKNVFINYYWFVSDCCLSPIISGSWSKVSHDVLFSIFLQCHFHIEITYYQVSSVPLCHISKSHQWRSCVQFFFLWWRVYLATSDSECFIHF